VLRPTPIGKSQLPIGHQLSDLIPNLCTLLLPPALEEGLLTVERGVA